MMDGPLAIGDPCLSLGTHASPSSSTPTTLRQPRRPTLLEEIAKYGTPTVKRAYGDWTTQSLKGWKDELLRHAIQPMQQFANTTR